MSSNHEEFLARLKNLQGDLTDAAFARKVGVPATTLKQYEKGSVPSILIAARIADVCNVSIDWLAGRDSATRKGVTTVSSHHLTEALSIVEEWLDAEDRVMSPKKKAAVVTQIYQLIVDDATEGKTPLDKKWAQRILHLVA